MKKLCLLVGLTVLTGCSSNQPTPLQKVSPVIVKNEGVPLFSVPVPHGRWYLSASSKTTMTDGFIHVEGAFPNPAGIPHSISIKLESIERWPESLSQVLPLFKSGNYRPYLDASLEWYTPARVKEHGIKNFGGEVIKFKEFSCVDIWSGTTVGPQTHEGRGIALYSSSVNCPLVVNGHVYRFSMWVTTYIGAWYYNVKESYEKTRKPSDPEFPSSLDELLKSQHKEDYLSSIGPTVAQLFSGIQFYGKVSQNYADIEHPELLQQKIDYPELYQPQLQSRRRK